MEDIQKNKALEILEKKLDEKGIQEFLSISNDMEMIFGKYPELDMETAKSLIEDYFSNRGESKEFIDKWLGKAQAHCKKYGIEKNAMPKAMVADLGMFRFMSFFEEYGLSEQEIFQIFSGAADQVSDVEFKVPGTMSIQPEHKCSCRHHGDSND